MVRSSTTTPARRATAEELAERLRAACATVESAAHLTQWGQIPDQAQDGDGATTHPTSPSQRMNKRWQLARQPSLSHPSSISHSMNGSDMDDDIHLRSHSTLIDRSQSQGGTRAPRCVMMGCKHEPLGGRGFCAAHAAHDAAAAAAIMTRQTSSGGYEKGSRSGSPIRPRSLSPHRPSLPPVRAFTSSLSTNPYQPAILAAQTIASAVTQLFPTLPTSAHTNRLQTHTSLTTPPRTEQRPQSRNGMNGTSNVSDEELISSLHDMLAGGVTPNSTLKLSSQRTPTSIYPRALPFDDGTGRRVMTPRSAERHTPRAQSSPSPLQPHSSIPSDPPSSPAVLSSPVRALRTPAGLALSYEHGRKMKSVRKDVLVQQKQHSPSAMTTAPNAQTQGEAPNHQSAQLLAHPLSRNLHVNPALPIRRQSGLTATLNGAPGPSYAAENGSVIVNGMNFSPSSPALSAHLSPPLPSNDAQLFVGPSSPAIRPSVTSDIHPFTLSSPIHKPMSAVQRQRAYRAALLSKALSKPSNVQSLSQTRLDVLDQLLRKRRNFVDLLKKKILYSSQEERDAETRAKQNKKENLAHFFEKGMRPSVETLAKKHILKDEKTTALEAEDLFAKKQTLANFLQKRPSIVVAMTKQIQEENKSGHLEDQIVDEGEEEEEEAENEADEGGHSRYSSTDVAALPSPSSPSFRPFGSNFSNPAGCLSRGRGMSFSNLRFNVSRLLSSRPTPNDLKALAKEMLGDMVQRGVEQEILAQEARSEEQKEAAARAQHGSSSSIITPTISMEALSSSAPHLNLKVDELLAEQRRLRERKLRNQEEEDVGGVYVLGSNEYGQLGVPTRYGEQPFIGLPTHVPSLLREVVVQVACGFQHTLVRTSTGTVYSCGKNSYGQLGLGDTCDRGQPFSLMSFRSSPLHRQVATWIAAYEKTSGVVTENGEVFTMGSVESGSLGVGDPAQSREAIHPLPVELMELRDKNIHRLSLGGAHGAALDTQGQLWTWGRNMNGEAGNGDFTSVWRPKLIKGYGEWWAELSCGEEHVAAIGFDGNTYLWGSNKNGQLGFVSTPEWNSPQPTPKVAPSLLRKGIVRVSAGRHHTAVVGEEGEAFCTLVIDEARQSTEKCKFHRLKPTLLNFVDVVATPIDHVVAVDSKGVLRIWEPNQTADPKRDDTLETRTLNQIAVGLEHMAIVGTISKRWRKEAIEAANNAQRREDR